VSHAGLVPAIRLVQNVGLEELVTEYVGVAAKVGADPGVKVGSLVAGMVVGADTIEGMDLLRHGAMSATFGRIRSPSRLGSFLRAFTHGNVRQLAAVHRRVLARLAASEPLLPGADTLAFMGQLRCAELEQPRSLIEVGQITRASSSKAARIRRFTVSSAPSS
jgi:hypothetical protein